MQIGQSSASFQLRFDAGSSSRTGSTTAEQQAKRTLAALSSAKVFEDNQRVLSSGVRASTFNKVRAPLHRQVETELADLKKQLDGFALSTIGQAGAAGAVGGFLAAGPSRVTSAEALNLGDGTRVSGTTTTTYQPPAVEATLDPTAKLATQPFTNPITAGSLTVTFQVNGGGNTNRTIAIDPNVDSLDSVLTKLNNLTVSGKKPLNATYDAATGTIDFKVTSNGGTNFDFTFGADSSGFLQAIGADGVEASRQITASNAIVNNATRTKYFNLSISVEGAGTSTFNNLQVSSAGLSIDQKVDELVTQINAGLAGTGLTALNAGGGKLGFTSDDPNAPLRPDLGVSITQSSRAGAVGLGFQTGGGGRFNAVTDVVANPELTSTAPPPVTTTTSYDRNVSGALGTSATLRDLSDQLGLQAVNGQFSLAVNGQQLTFNEDQTLDQVLAGFSAAGVTATYSTDTRRITVDAGAGALSIQDAAGNLADRLGIEVQPADANNAKLAGEVSGFVQALDNVVKLLETSTKKGSGLEDDRLLEDLREALGGLFTPSSDGSLRGLADLGFSREGDELRIDGARLAELAADRTSELNAFLGGFFNERVNPLIEAGTRALQDASEVGAAEAQAATQAVRVRGDLARLSTRQQMLALEQLNYEGMRERLERQDRELEKIARDLERRNANGLPTESEDAARVAQLLAAERKADFPPIAGPSAVNLNPGVGLTSFGLGQSESA